LKSIEEEAEADVVGSLLTAIVRADGDALVMHVGERPYVVAPAGPVELSSRPLTLDAVAGMLGQLLPAEGRAALDELGAIEHELPRGVSGTRDRFTVVAARGGDDIWIEVRRHRKPAAPAVVVPTAVAVPPVPQPEARASEEPAPTAAPAVAASNEASAQPPPEAAAPSEAAAPGEEAPGAGEEAAEVEPEPAAVETVPEEVIQPAPAAVSPAVGALASRGAAVAAEATEAVPEPVAASPEVPAPEPAPAPEPLFDAFEKPAEPASAPEPIEESAAARPEGLEEKVERQPAPVVESIPAVVLPLARSPLRPEAPRVSASPRLAGIDRLLRLAAARGANTLYLMSQSRPAVRVDGEIATLEGERALTAVEVESLLLDLAPERSREALENGEGTEWMSEVAEVGRIRCQSFRDHRGPGGIFRIISARPASADQLGLSREIQALAAEPEGLILVAGPRASGKSTLVSAFVDLVNEARSDYVITIESQIQFAHEGRGCLVSQREVRGDAGKVAVMTRSALRENPDVLVIDDLRSPEVMGIAVDAVAAGHLVIAAMPAHTATAALVRLIDQAAPDRREQVRLTLAEGLRCVVAQVLLHKSSGGRVAAREVLLNTPAIANLIAEGRVDQLPLALEGGRKHGMAPLNDALAAFVQSGVVDAREAYRKAYERQAFVAVLRREGLDTSFLERLA